MGTVKRFEDIEAWQKARLLSKEIYIISLNGLLHKDFKLRDQINAASGSVMDNIAEGFDRGGRLEFVHFLSIAKGSCAEVQSQLQRMFDREYVTEEKFRELYKLTEDICNMIGGWIKYLIQSDHKGSKFKNRV